MELANFKVESFSFSENVITWELVPVEYDITSYYFTLYRSESPGLEGSLEEYDEVTNLSYNATTYTDTYVAGIESHTRIYYYKLAINDGSAEELLTNFPGYYKPTRSDYAAREIIRRKYLSLKGYVGRTFYLMKKRTWGTRCPICWDEARHVVTDPNCETCHGTGFVGAYFNGIPFQAMINPSPKYTEINMFGEWHPSSSLLTMMNYPLLAPKDVVVDDSGKRWQIMQIQKLEKLGRIIEQSAQLNLIALHEEVYKIPVDRTNAVSAAEDNFYTDEDSGNIIQ